MIPISRKRLFTTTVGIILAIAIIFTSYTLGNNMSKYQFYQHLQQNPYEIKIQDLNGSVDNIIKSYWEIKNISHVDNVILDLWGSGTYFKNNTSKYLPPSTAISLNYLLGFNITIIKGHLPRAWNEIAIGEGNMRENNWSVGQKIAIYFYNRNGAGMSYVNYTIVGVVSWASPGYGSEKENFTRGALISLSGIKYLGQSTSLISCLGVSLDPHYLLESTDYSNAFNKVEKVSNEVNGVLWSNNIKSFSTETSLMLIPMTSYSLIFAVFFSLPVIVMGAYLSRVGIEIELLERRREFGILKIRGATSKTLSKFIIIEALIYMLFGGVLGYLFGEALAYISNMLFFHMPYFILDWGVWELVGAVVSSAFLFFIALYTPWKKIKKEPIINLISHYSQSFKKAEYTKKRMDLILSVILWVYLITGIVLMKNVTFVGGFNIIVIIAFIIMTTFVVFFPIILIVLPLVMSRLLTMGTTWVYKFIASGIAKLFKTSGNLAERSIERSPKRAAYLAFILAFIIAISSFLAITATTTQEESRLSSISEIGGDVLINLQTNPNMGIPWGLLNDTKKVSSYVVAYYINESSTLTLNMQDYMNSIYDGKTFLKGGSFGKDEVVISSTYARSYGVGVGDYIVISINGYSTRYKIEAIMYTFPGLEGSDIIVDSKNPKGMPGYIIIKAKNLTAVEDYLTSMNYNYQTLHKNKNQIEMQFIEVLLIYLVMLGTASIVIVQYSSLLNRRGEIALYKVRGARNSQIAAMLMTEGITVIILSLLIGVAIGVLLAYSISLIMSFSGTIPSVFVVGMNFVVYTVVLLIAYLVSQYILSYLFAKTKPSEVIRGLGGEI